MTCRSASDRRGREGEREIVVDEAACGPARRPDADEPIVAARHLDPLERDGVEDLRRGERQHGEVDARQPHDEEAEQRRPERGGDRRERQRELHRRAEMAQRQRGAIGAEPEIGGMAEAHEAAGADQEMQREGEQAEDQDLGRDLQGIGVAEQRQQRSGRQASRARSPSRPRPSCRSRPPIAATWAPAGASGRPRRPYGRSDEHDAP